MWGPQRDLLVFSKQPHVVEKVRHESYETRQGLFLMEESLMLLLMLLVASSSCNCTSLVCSGILSQHSSYWPAIPWPLRLPHKEAGEARVGCC